MGLFNLNIQEGFDSLVVSAWDRKTSFQDFIDKKVITKEAISTRWTQSEYLCDDQGILLVDTDMNQIYECIKKNMCISDINSLEDVLQNQADVVSKTACLAKDILEFAEEGNEVALSVIQEGTRNVAEYIIYLIDEMNFSKDKVIIAGNGSIIKNDFYRKSLNDALQFDLNDLHWIFSDVSCAYSAGIIAAQCNNIDISINNVIKHIN